MEKDLDVEATHTVIGVKTCYTPLVYSTKNLFFLPVFISVIVKIAASKSIYGTQTIHDTFELF